MMTTTTKRTPASRRTGLALGVFAAAALLASFVGCGAKDDKSDKTTAPAPQPQQPQAPQNAPKDSDAEKQTDLKNTDLLKIASPCKEDEENTGRVIKVDNEPVAQFCKNRMWGNPWVDASSFKCQALGFVPVLTDDKTGVSCRNAQGVVSLKTRWYPSGRGLELCNPSEYNLWMLARDTEGYHIAVRCEESGVLDGSGDRTRFACDDPDRSYSTKLVGDGKGVACMNDANQVSLLTNDGDNYMINSNCPSLGSWMIVKDRNGRKLAARCEAFEPPAPGRFLNLSASGTRFCGEGEEPVLKSDGSEATCEPR